MKTSIKVKNRVLYTKNDIEKIANNILAGKIGINNIPHDLRISDRRFYRYAFRYVRGLHSKQKYHQLYELLKSDIILSQGQQEHNTLFSLLKDYEEMMKNIDLFSFCDSKNL